MPRAASDEGAFQSIHTSLSAASLVEQAATILGFWGVWLMIRQSLLAFPVGLLQVALSSVVFFEARLYADMKLQAVFFACLAYGWWHWKRAAQTGGDGSVATWMSPRNQALSVLGGLLLTALWGFYLSRNTDAAMPYRDAFIASFSIIAQWLQARRRHENWLFWILVNATAVPVYWAAGIHWFAILYFCFLIMAVTGFVAWLRSTRSPGQAAQPVGETSAADNPSTRTSKAES